VLALLCAMLRHEQQPDMTCGNGVHGAVDELTAPAGLRNVSTIALNSRMRSVPSAITITMA
jgi:hypothetical protein